MTLRSLLPVGAQDRLRAAFALLVVLGAGVSLALLLAGGRPLAEQAAGVVALAVLLAAWGRIYVKGVEPLVGSALVEAGALLGLSLVAGAPKVLLAIYLGVVFRSLHTCPQKAAYGGLLFGAVHVAAAASDAVAPGEYPIGEAIAHVPVIVLAAAISATFARVLVDHEAALGREVTLRAATAAFAGGASADLPEAAVTTAVRLAGEDGRAALWLGDQHALHLAKASGPEDWPQGGDAHELVEALEDAGATVCRVRVRGRLLGVLAVEGESDQTTRSALQALADELGLALTAHAATEERVTALLEASSDVIVHVDADGVIRYASPAAGPMLGVPADRLVGCRLAEALPVDHPQALAGLLASAGRTGLRHAAVALRVPGEEPRSLEAVAVDRSKDERLGGVVVTIRDVTEHARARADLTAAKELLQAVVDRIPAAIFVKDLDGRITLANAACEWALGRKADQLVGRTVFELFDRQDAEDYATIDRELLAGRADGLSFEQRRLHPDGMRTFFTQISMLGDLDQPRGVIGVSTDITTRVRAEEALKASEQRFRSMVEDASVGVWATDRDQRTTYVNEALAQMLGLTPADMLGRTPFEFTDAEGEAITARALDRRRHGVRERYETKFLHRNGREVWVAISATPQFDDDGAFTGSLGVFEDVTEQRLAADERKALESRLHQRERLETVGRLAGGVAHDFNNLLAVILNYADFVAEELDPEEPAHADVQEISRAADRARALTRQLLTFSRRDLPADDVLELCEVVRETERLLRRTLGEDIGLTATTCEERTPVRIDRGRLEQVLLNLVVNARDAMPGGGSLELRVTHARLDGTRYPELVPGAYAVVEVADTGTGMGPDVLARAFEPFFTTKPPGEGTGLGLATVYGAVQQAGGVVDMASAPGEGTTVRVLLPLEPGVPEREEDAPPDVAATGVVDGATVLVVEDEDGVRELTRRILERGGYRVLAAADGDAALALLRRHAGEVALLLTDVVMPGMSGKELVERAADLAPGLPAIFMSGYTDEVVLRHGIATRSVAFVDKPFDADALLEAVHAALVPEGLLRTS